MRKFKTLLLAFLMVFMYAYNAQKNGWWDQVTLLIWGPSSKLTSEDAEIQESPYPV